MIEQLQSQITQQELFKTALSTVSSVMRLAEDGSGAKHPGNQGASSEDEHTRLLPMRQSELTNTISAAN